MLHDVTRSVSENWHILRRLHEHRLPQQALGAVEGAFRRLVSHRQGAQGRTDRNQHDSLAATRKKSAVLLTGVYVITPIVVRALYRPLPKSGDPRFLVPHGCHQPSEEEQEHVNHRNDRQVLEHAVGQVAGEGGQKEQTVLSCPERRGRMP